MIQLRKYRWTCRWDFTTFLEIEFQAVFPYCNTPASSRWRYSSGHWWWYMRPIAYTLIIYDYTHYRLVNISDIAITDDVTQLISCYMWATYKIYSIHLHMYSHPIKQFIMILLFIFTVNMVDGAVWTVHISGQSYMNLFCLAPNFRQPPLMLPYGGRFISSII